MVDRRCQSVRFGFQLDELSAAAVGGILALGILASLPVMFVVFHVLFEDVRSASAFARAGMRSC
jgi:hypothetical protein